MHLDWSLLLPEILQLISEKVISITDFVRFRAVCNTWRSASSPRPQHLPPQLPWLILPRGPSEENNHCSMLSVYDLSQSRTHIIDLPEIQDKRICGCSNGWLILEDHEVWLLNPITRDHISLPSLYVGPKMFLNLSGENRTHYSLDLAMEFCVEKAILSSNPGIDPDCLVMALFEGAWELAFCRIGDKCWTVISEYEDNVVDIGFHNGLLYVLYEYGHVRICDIHTPSFKVINPEQKFYSVRSVEGCYDEHGLRILCFNRSIAFKPSPPADIHSIVTWSDKQENWLDVVEENLRSNIFFLGYGFKSHCTSLPVANMKLEEWEGNYMCYISRRSKRIDDVKWYSFDMELFGLNNGSKKTIVSPLVDLKKIECGFDGPSFFWLTPTLC